MQMPFALLEAALFSLIVYFWVGFEASASCFFLFYFIIVCAILMQSCLFRMLACICPNMVLANAGGSILLLILIVSSGFVLVRKSIPGYDLSLQGKLDIEHTLGCMLLFAKCK